MENVGIALLLSAWAYIAVVLWLAPGLWLNEPLVSGLITGLLVGNVQLGLAVGATLTLASLGLGTYGGTTIPDVMTGSIVGTALAVIAAKGDIAVGIAIGIATATLMTQMDILGRATTTIFIHSADNYAKAGNAKGVAWMHLLGQLPWGLTRFIPVFLAITLGRGPIESFVSLMQSPDWAWLLVSLRFVGSVLPALGFALLLSIQPVRKYWGYLLLGYILFAYLKLPIIAIALVAVVAVFLVNFSQKKGSVANV
jgi:PTS system mannose-specific IIC component